MVQDDDKTKQQLIVELVELRHRIAELDKVDLELKRAVAFGLRPFSVPTVANSP